MSNVIFSPFYKSHPVFKADQVLSDVHLNDMLQYLEKENTQTRSQLIGSGILEGFAFQLKKENDVTTLNISNGKGVTSTGQLIIQADDGGLVSHSHAIQYEYEHLASEFPDLPEGSMVYALVPDRPDDIEKPEGLVPLSTLLDNNFDTGLAAVQESVDIQIQSCFITNCDERGVQRKFAIKYLLIQVPGSIASAQTDHQSTLRRIERIQIAASNNPELPKAYAKACSNEFIDWLHKEILEVKGQLIPDLRQFVSVTDFQLTGLNLKGKRDLTLNKNPHHLQYFYDFLIDLGQTIEEIIRLRQTVRHQLYQLTNHRPHHLMLGHVKGRLAIFNKNHFQPVLPDRQDRDQLEKLASLCQRLGSMLTTFNIPVKADAVQITPTNSRKYPVSEATIPFYYELALKTSTWSTSAFQDEIPLSGSLDYFHDNKDSLLIERIIGLGKTVALNSLLKLKRKHHLSTGIIALRVSEKDHDVPYSIPKKPEPGSINEFNFKEFIIEHPGLYHSSSVPKGGTLVVVFKAEPGQTDGPVVATLVLPYVCCGQKQAAPEPEPFVLKATGDQGKVLTEKSLDITVLDNDQFDKDSPIEVDFIYDLAATNDQTLAITGKQIDIRSLQNDLFDRDAPIQVDLIQELDAKDVQTKTLTDKSIDINVLQNDNVGPGPVELDFDKDN
ncbi:MAG: hypothetical protein HEP71_07880 [Roseivirga sp.]|nr:hypothetical protein [Roseivirga sp.]